MPNHPSVAAPAVLLDLLQGIPLAPLVLLRPGEQYRQTSHVVLIQVGGWVVVGR